MPSWIRSRNGRPWLRYRFAIETTRRRFASTISCFARVVAALDPLRELDLLGGGQQLDAADVLEEELERVGRDLARLGARGRARPRGAAAVDDVDLELLERRVELVHLARRRGRARRARARSPRRQRAVPRDRPRAAPCASSVSRTILDGCDAVTRCPSRSSGPPPARVTHCRPLMAAELSHETHDGAIGRTAHFSCRLVLTRLYLTSKTRQEELASPAERGPCAVGRAREPQLLLRALASADPDQHQTEVEADGRRVREALARAGRGARTRAGGSAFVNRPTAAAASASGSFGASRAAAANSRSAETRLSEPLQRDAVEELRVHVGPARARSSAATGAGGGKRRDRRRAAEARDEERQARRRRPGAGVAARDGRTACRAARARGLLPARAPRRRRGRPRRARGRGGAGRASSAGARARAPAARRGEPGPSTPRRRAPTCASSEP